MRYQLTILKEVRFKVESNSKQLVLKCFHCGNDTLMNLRGMYSYNSHDYKYEEFDFNCDYELYECPICHEPTLYSDYSDETMFVPFRDDGYMEHDTKIMFPVNQLSSDKGIPDKVKKAYEAALKVKNIDMNICLIALRRTLELLLKDQGATSWGLKSMIEEVAGKGVLPDSLKEASSLTKMLGDTAAHDKEMEISQHDVESMSEFVNYIIEYIYVVPQKISAYKENIKKNE